METIKLNPQFDNLDNPEIIINHIEALKKDATANSTAEILEFYRIDPKEDIKPPPVAWSQVETGAVLGTLGNFSLIIGKAKSRKSFFMNIAVSTVLSEDIMLGQFKGSLPIDKRKVLYFDTEQGRYHVQLALNRICKQIGNDNPKNLLVYGLRSESPSDRLKLIEYAIKNTENLGFVIIDGIKDLINSINDESEATMIASKLLKWTEQYGIHIITILHQNKSDNNARGHIGTELINKAETVLSVTKSEHDKDISVVEAQQCRNKEPMPFAFEINDYGLPQLVDDYELRTTKKRRVKNILLDLERYKQFKVLTEVFSRGDYLKYTELVIQVKLASKKQHKKDVGDNKIKEFITHCKNENWLLQEADKRPYQLGEFDDE